jgi:gamma-glutamyl:cysteine ligase YbdK (ATP-grasp superfamily)
MERMVTASPRIQILTSRLALQEERVYRLDNRLDSLRSELEGVQMSTTQLSARVKQIEEALARIPDPAERTAFEEQVTMLKAQLTLESGREQSLRVREAEAVQALAAEQNRWEDLNRRLDDLERLLDRR